MDRRWFKEEQALPRADRKKAIEETTKVLVNSTIMARKLKGICEHEIESTYKVEEDVHKDYYERLIIAAGARRKAFKDIIKLLPKGG